MSDARMLEGAGALRTEAGLYRAVEGTGSAIVYSDSFERAATTPTGSGGAGLGSEWVGSVWRIYNPGNGVAWADGAGFTTMLHDLGSDHWAECTVPFGATNGKYAGPAVRLTGDGSRNGYYGFVDAAPTNTVQIWRLSTGGDAQVGSSAAFTQSDNHLLRLEAQGTTLRLYVDNVLKITGTDSALSGHYGGMYGDGSNNDNFRCGALPWTA